MSRLRRAVPLLVLVSAVAGIGAAQLPARAMHSTLRETSDTNALPPPHHTVVLSLGYRAALADLLWAQLLVSQGLRLQERRRLGTTVPLLETINELDPSWRAPYRMADSLVTLQSKAASLDEVRATRRILERGVRERPHDAELWLILGQFVGHIMPNNYLEDLPEEAEEWRRAGAEYLARAAELGGSDPSIQWQAIGAARIFAQTGKLSRAIEMYTHMLATTEDPELRAELERQLAVLEEQRRLGAQEEEVLKHRARRASFEALSRASYPGVLATGARLLGYPRDTAACAGGALAPGSQEPRCSESWRQWAERAPFGDSR